MLEALQGFFSWSLYGIPAFLFLITVVVFFHELGHFATARLFGVRVETFSIGFGRALYSWTDKLGTRWKISWVPLGGFVKFFGDTDGTSRPDRHAATQMSPADRAAAFQFKPLWQRALVVAAGPAANFVLAFVILAGFFMIIGRIVTPASVTEVVPHSAAQLSGIRAGDTIVSIDGDAIRTKGDANRTPDTWSFASRQIVGVVTHRLAHGGYVLVYFQQPEGIASVMTAMLSIVLLWGLCFPGPRDDEPSPVEAAATPAELAGSTAH